MKIWKPSNRLAGFMCATEGADQLPFEELGEVWATLSWKIDWHTNAGWEVYMQVKGASCWRVGNESMRVREGEIYWIGPGLRHRLEGFEGGAIHFLYLVVRAEDLRVLEEFPSLCAAGFRVLSGSPELLEQLKGLVHEVAAERPWREAVCQARLDLLGYELARRMERGPRPPGKGKPLHPAALRAMDLLRTNPGYSWTLPELSARAGLSVPHLCAVFKREYAQTPMRALQRLRVEEALRRLRETDQSITDLAMDLGFASSQHFSREFRRHTGKSAREVRCAGL